MNKLTSDRDLYDDLLYMNDPEGLERVKAIERKSKRRDRGKNAGRNGKAGSSISLESCSG